MEKKDLLEPFRRFEIKLIFISYKRILYRLVTSLVFVFFFQALQQLVPGDEPIYSFRPQLMDRYYVANFYLGDRLKVFDHDWPTDGLLITGEYDFAELKARLPHPYEFEEITRLTRPNHETGQRTLLMRFRTPGQ